MTAPATKQRTYRPPLVPVPLDGDHDLARWLARESFEKAAASDGLRIVDYTEREVPPAEVPEAYRKQLGIVVEDYAWFEFVGTAELDRPLFDWLAAEIEHGRQQYAQWLEAEADWRSDQTTRWLTAERQWTQGDAPRV